MATTTCENCNSKFTVAADAEMGICPEHGCGFTNDLRPPEQDPLEHPRIATGGSFVYDVPDTPPALWGTGEQILWAQGEGLLIAGPTGTGKSTIAAQLVAARLGLIDTLLGHHVTPDDRPLLYIAMDRPAQLQRLLARLFRHLDADRRLLDQRLLVWRGPLPALLNSRPEVLVDLAHRLDAGTVIVDSLKDAAVKLTDDESGGNINRAFQMLLAEGHDLGVLHHQRKGTAEQTKAPKGIDDIYGSALITAGMGSVLALHGQPGDPVVDLLHLKQPMENCGPIRVEHDDRTGLTAVAAKFDPLAFLRHRTRGATARDAAIAKFDKQDPTDAEVVRARRELDRLVRTMSGQVVRDEPQIGGDGGSKGARYRFVDATDSTDSPPTRPPTQGSER